MTDDPVQGLISCSFVAMRCRDFVRQSLPEQPLLKRASVALVLVQGSDDAGETALLLTRRAPTLRNHSSQWALPGGRSDDNETATQAALRELQEETNLRLGEGAVLGTLDDFDTKSGYRITPIVVWADDVSALLPNVEEVASIHLLPLPRFTGAGAADFYVRAGHDRPVLRYRMDDSNLHAPTAAIIFQLCEMLDGRITRVADFEQPRFTER
jgi:8-oxo-dGTP pyrophosphatase MutT (NUDIX family)